MTNIFTKEKIKHFSLILVGLVGLWLFLDHNLKFSFPNYFYNDNPTIEKYIGTNVVGVLADYSFFTYHTLIFFSFFCLLLGLSSLFNLKKMNSFLHKDTVVCFVFLNYLMTIVLYTVFELCSEEITFGLYAVTPKAFHNFGTNIVVHFVYFILATIVFIKIKTNRAQSKKAVVYISCYFSAYYIFVKISGEYLYCIKWFPYIIFDAKSFGESLGITNYFASVVSLILCISIIIILYFTAYSYLVYSKNKNSK